MKSARPVPQNNELFNAIAPKIERFDLTAERRKLGFKFRKLKPEKLVSLFGYI
jgi:hypothetical protein